MAFFALSLSLSVSLSLCLALSLLNIIASVLHLGNIQYGGEDSGNAYITTDTQIKYLARLLGVDGLVLKEALTHKKIIAKGEELKSPLNLEQASSARDALSKAVYGRTFTWLVNKINVSLAYKDETYKNASVIGLLDIYGFEVFQHNSFEQFCINYCNEKLQQLFIELTLKSEQDEYEAEGITVRLLSLCFVSPSSPSPSPRHSASPLSPLPRCFYPSWRDLTLPLLLSSISLAFILALSFHSPHLSLSSLSGPLLLPSPRRLCVTVDTVIGGPAPLRFRANIGEESQSRSAADLGSVLACRS
ncbi:unnamed protein product [Oncorhynchus mykiss]|uniref:Myosin motor domain-containing protein n=1 Tax=Oncorhynchus mykiss TaxID=8022 RepID=A0A060Z487_ONCMY|nr:unnamed protein product [Oncorhynchus mykiss]